MDVNWVRFALTVLTGGIVSSLTDWLFMGDWLYKRYNQYPEIWRYAHGQGEMKAIAWSAPLPFVTCAVFTLFVRPLRSPLVQRDFRTGARYLACRTFALTHRACAVHQTATRNCGGVFPRVASLLNS